MLLKQPSTHLIRRPMSIFDAGEDWRTFMVKPVGPASRELAALIVGDSLEVSADFGRGFPAFEKLKGAPLLLVGGGFGVAPLHFLARALDKMGGVEYSVVYGGRTAGDIELEVLDDIEGRVFPSTDDGTLGFHGTCVQLAEEKLELAADRAQETIILTCGSHLMMRALYDALGSRVASIYVSLEEVMACGVGVCMGCVHPSTQGYVPICTAGPVFEADQVFGSAVGTDYVKV